MVISFSKCLLGSNKSSRVGLIVGVSIGVSFLVLLIILAGIYALRQRKKAKRAVEKSNPFGKIRLLTWKKA